MLTHTLTININGPDSDDDEELEAIFKEGENVANQIEEIIHNLFVREGAQHCLPWGYSIRTHHD